MKKDDVLELLGPYLYTEVLIEEKQEVTHHKNGTAFWSYKTFIGANIGGQLYLSGYHDYSHVTNKWCKYWCGYTKSQRNDMLKKGTALYVTLD